MDPTHSSQTGQPTESTASSSKPLQPLQNPKYRHISRSAAKRESVQLLGSIKDLQLHFSRAAIEHRSGAGAGAKGLSSLGEEEERSLASGVENRPPPLEGRGGARERRPWKDVELPRVHPDEARREARQIVSTVRDLWGLSAPASPLASSSLPSSRSLYFTIPNQTEEDERTSDEIRSALVTTAQSIRRIRFLALASHQQGRGGARKVSASAVLANRAPGKVRSSFSTPSRPGGLPRAVSHGAERKSSLGPVDEGKDDGDGLADLRKAALDILASLRALEERLRLQYLERDKIAHAAHRAPACALSLGDSDVTSSASPSTAMFGDTSTVFTEPEGENELQLRGDGRYPSDEEEYNLNVLAQEDEKHHQTWEERLESEDREYRVLNDAEWEKEARGTREGVGKWVEAVERLFVVSEGRGEVESWALEEGWEGKELERLHAFLISHLPLELALHIPPTHATDFKSAFLSRISDGLLLIQAYNTALLSSSKPWGFIPDENVHDTLNAAAPSGAEGVTPNSEEGRKSEREWTFRRVGNLTCWAAALRHRYQLPIAMPASTSTSTTSFLPLAPSSRPATASPSPSSFRALSPKENAHKPLPPIFQKGGKDMPRIDFEPMVVAKRSEGWEGMLSTVVARWVDEVAKEVREGHTRVEKDEED